MKSYNLLLALLICLASCSKPESSESLFDQEEAENSINLAISEWDLAWEQKDVELAINSYSDSCDWTNAFGDRVQSKQDLEQLLSIIFGLDFVMSGKNNYSENDIEFVSNSTAIVRSQNIRTDQKWPDGSEMDDRIINHLRVFEVTDGKWLITHHMISQAWPKQRG